MRINTNTFKQYIIFNLAVLSLFLIDRWLKFYFLKNPAVTQDFIDGFFGLQLETNQGIAFGLPINSIFILVLIIVVLVLLISFLLKAYQRQDYLVIFSLSLIIAGAFSNLLDRLQHGFVIDYINLEFFTVFNLADSMITIGVGLIIFSELFLKNLDKKIKV